jgi:hypothetical protein
VTRRFGRKAEARSAQAATSMPQCSRANEPAERPFHVEDHAPAEARMMMIERTLNFGATLLCRCYTRHRRRAAMQGYWQYCGTGEVGDWVHVVSRSIGKVILAVVVCGLLGFFLLSSRRAIASIERPSPASFAAESVPLESFSLRRGIVCPAISPQAGNHFQADMELTHRSASFMVRTSRLYANQ